jgi:hypothetical protein
MVAWTGAGTEHCLAGGSFAGDDDIGNNLLCGRKVASGELNPIASGEVKQAAQEAVNPFLRHVWRQPERHEARQRLAAHGRDITQSTRQTLVSNAVRGMPLPSEVNVFNAKIGSHQKLVSGREAQNRAIIADAAHDGLAPRGERKPPNSINQLPLFQFQTHNFKPTISNPQFQTSNAKNQLTISKTITYIRADRAFAPGFRLNPNANAVSGW